MASPASDIELGWIRWRVERNRRGLRAGLIFVITLYPAFGLLDWLLAPPEALPWLWGTRLAILAFGLGVLRAMQSRTIDRYLDLVSAVSGWLTAAGISVMTAYM